MLQGSVVALVAVLMTGDASSLAALVPVMLLELGYSRELEREADEFAYGFLRESGITPDRFAVILGRLEREHGGWRVQEEAASDGGGWVYYLSTHPSTAQRIVRFSGEHGD